MQQKGENVNNVGIWMTSSRKMQAENSCQDICETRKLASLLVTCWWNLSRLFTKLPIISKTADCQSDISDKVTLGSFSCHPGNTFHKNNPIRYMCCWKMSNNYYFKYMSAYCLEMYDVWEFLGVVFSEKYLLLILNLREPTDYLVHKVPSV